MSEQKFTSEHSLCQGCAVPIVVNAILNSTDKQVVVGMATGCLEVASTQYPKGAWKVPFIHSLFENVAPTMAGVEAAYKALRKEGLKKEVKFIAFAGDGATYDIGLQALSGVLERGHDILYVCYDNEGYMNTGNQRSGATPHGANTTTQPAGKESYGKTQQRKNIMEIVAAHNIPYAAQASTADIPDLVRKARKALEMKGPRFLNVLSPCITNWKYDPKETVNVAKLAVETRFWPLYEIENGKYTINYEPKQNIPVEDFLKLQKRFAHLFKPENRHAIAELQANIDQEWEKLKGRVA